MLRFAGNPSVYNLWRAAAKDDVIPLSDPVVGADGTTTERGRGVCRQVIIISICGYNRSVHLEVTGSACGY